MKRVFGRAAVGGRGNWSGDGDAGGLLGDERHPVVGGHDDHGVVVGTGGAQVVDELPEQGIGRLDLQDVARPADLVTHPGPVGAERSGRGTGPIVERAVVGELPRPVRQHQVQEGEHRPVATGEVEAPEGDFRPGPGTLPVVEADSVLDVPVLVDARAAERYATR